MEPKSNDKSCLIRVSRKVEQQVRLLGVSGISIGETIANMVAVINADPALVAKVREMGFKAK